MNLIKVALSHCYCRTTLQCHRVVLNNRKWFLKEVSFQFPPKWDDRRSSPDSRRQRVSSPNCGHRKSAIADRCAACRRSSRETDSVERSCRPEERKDAFAQVLRRRA